MGASIICNNMITVTQIFEDLMYLIKFNNSGAQKVTSTNNSILLNKCGQTSFVRYFCASMIQKKLHTKADGVELPRIATRQTVT